MSRSNDAGHFFQTSEALATEERKGAKAKNKYGDPIKLPSKILAIHSDAATTPGDVYVAEAAGDVRKIDVESGKHERIFTQATAPLTCLATCPTAKMLFAGSWDKTIYAVPANKDSSSKVQKLQGHTDFVKCLHTASLEGQPILISGGADAAIIVWDISPENFGKQLHKLKGHTKALQDLAVDPLSIDASDKEHAAFTLFSASSDREIRRWHISRTTAHELEKPILAHETSIYALCWDSDGDLWTASADKTAKHLVRDRDWAADTVLPHPDFVRDVLPFEQLGLVVTACRDEEVRVWDMASGDLVCTYTGHFEEVTGLIASSSSNFRGVVSASIDGTVRKWSLDRAEMKRYQDELARAENGDDVDAGADKAEAGASMLTAEEEAELAELMEDDDND